MGRIEALQVVSTRVQKIDINCNGHGLFSFGELRLYLPIDVHRFFFIDDVLNGLSCLPLILE